jgi:hypothetical protein
MQGVDRVVRLGVTSGHVGAGRLPVFVDNPLRRWLEPRNHLRSRPIAWNRRTRRSRRSRKPAITFAVFNTCSNDDHSRRSKHRRLSFFAIFATFCSRDPSTSISGSSHERASRQPLGRSLPSRLFVRGFIDLRRRAGAEFVPVHRDVTLVPPTRRAHFMSSTTSGDSLGGRHDALGLGREHGRTKRTRSLDRVVRLGPTVRHREAARLVENQKPSLTPRSRPAEHVHPPDRSVQDVINESPRSYPRCSWHASVHTKPARRRQY